MNACTVGENAIKDQNKVRNKTVEAISSSVFDAERQTQVNPTCISSLLPLFSDCAHFVHVVMISHAITVISKAVKYLNPEQTVVIACDQPLFALQKTIQWAPKDSPGEDILVVMHGWLQAAPKAIGT